MLKRKKIKYDDETYESSDFNKRYKKAFSRGLRDHRDSSEFTLNEFQAYKDDPNKEIYEIIGSGIDST